MIRMTGIRKTFASNGAKALEGADFALDAGEIHAVFGENGAGKSTLMHVLAGILRPDAGTITVNGRAARFRSAADASRAGIRMVRQRPEVCPGLRVWEGCALGAETRRGPFMRLSASRKEAERLDASWGLGLPLDAPAVSLDSAGRLSAAILAALLAGTRVIIFDEPTAALGGPDTARFFALLRRLSAGGVTVVIISHKIDETLAIASRATVLRKGRTAGLISLTPTVGASDRDAIINMMFGDTSAVDENGAAASTVSVSGADAHTAADGTGDVVLQTERLSVGAGVLPPLRSVSVQLRGGAICGAAGVKESGVETLALAVAGFVRPSGGKVVIKGREVQSPRGFREAGGVYLTGGEPSGASGGTSVWTVAPSPCGRTLPLHDNLVIHAHRRFPHPVRFLARLGFLDRRGLGEWTRALLKDAGLRNGKAPASALSGGTLQRLLVMRELAEDAPFVMMSEPGWSLDAQRRRVLLAMFEREAAKGKAVMLFFSDLNDLLDVSDSVIVLHDGAVALDIRGVRGSAGDGTGADGVKERISGAMGGVRSSAPSRTTALSAHQASLSASTETGGGRRAR